MSTRAIINFVDVNTGESRKLYHHWSGSPDGIGRELAVLTAHLNQGWKWGYYEDSIVYLAQYVQNKGLCGGRLVDHDYDDGSDMDSDWISYRYTLAKDGDRWTLTCTDNGGNDCTDRIPQADISDESRMYEIKMVVDEDEYRRLIDQNYYSGDLAYGRKMTVKFRDEGLGWAVVTRTRDAKPRKRFVPFLKRKRA